MTRDIEYLVCPACSISWALKEGLPRGAGNITRNTLLVDIRQSEGRAGIKHTGGVTIGEAMNDPEYQPLLQEMRRRCQRFLAVTLI